VFKVQIQWVSIRILEPTLYYAIYAGNQFTPFYPRENRRWCTGLNRYVPGMIDLVQVNAVSMIGCLFYLDLFQSGMVDRWFAHWALDWLFSTLVSFASNSDWDAKQGRPIREITFTVRHTMDYPCK